MNNVQRFAMVTICNSLFTVFAQDINITGTVVDTADSQIAIAGAIVRLADLPSIETITNASGRFILTGSITGTLPRIRSKTLPFDVQINGNCILFSGKNYSARVLLEIFTISGLRIYHAEKMVYAGELQAFPSQWRKTGLYVIKIVAADNTLVLKCFGNAERNLIVRNSAKKNGDQGSLAAVSPHTIEVAKFGYFLKQVAAAGETFNAGIIRLKGLERPMAMKEIPAGTFTMGKAGSADTVHQVTLSAFAMQETEVTQEQYLAVMGTNPSHFTGDNSLPVEQVSWFNAVNFCNTLSKLAGLDTVYSKKSWIIEADFTNKGYRLPTEAEWEYACRAGAGTAYWWGPDTNGMGDRTWSNHNSRGTTQPVATKLANSYGLYDMTGNVWEWCNDWYEPYPAGVAINPTGPLWVPEAGDLRVMRGGSWYFNYLYTVSASRNYFYASYVNFNIDYFGFRVVLSR